MKAITDLIYFTLWLKREEIVILINIKMFSIVRCCIGKKEKKNGMKMKKGGMMS